ncbi:MAG TPA: dTMP kinase [Dehalococcoidia bacterium]|nr:dTMP kinase [Dehalococcoidia bacterium]
MNTHTARGKFIVIEGGDGAGKSRLQHALHERLVDGGHEVVLTREPGGTELGERVRELVLAQGGVGDPLSELLLFEAARAQLAAEVIRPALKRGCVVVCDRFAASSTAYQGFGRGLGRDLVERANAIATGGLAPDMTLLLDVPVDVGLRRRAGDGGANHFDNEAVAFHERVRAGFLELARDGGDAWCVIDGSREFGDVVTVACAALERVLA